MILKPALLTNMDMVTATATVMVMVTVMEVKTEPLKKEGGWQKHPEKINILF